jgi:carbonic anhydrase/acetyltransferase-like protein (isoleucine patch superfamily)
VPIYALEDQSPRVHPDAFVHPDAVIIGAVTVGAGSTVWPGAVLRGDVSTITVGERTSVQDGVIVHCSSEVPTVIGDDVVIGHNATLEGCTVEDGALIGAGSVVWHHAVVGREALVGTGAVVPTGKVVPPLAMALGVPARMKEGALAPGHTAQASAVYAQAGRRYKTAMRRVG